MTRLPPIVFALILGLIVAAVFYLFLFIEGNAEQRLQWTAGAGSFMTVIAWFMARRVRAKSGSEQGKQRWLAVGFMFIFIGGYMFVDYKTVEGNFIDACIRSGSRQLCECIEEKIGPTLWAHQLPRRPLVALGKLSLRDMMREVRGENHRMLEAAANQCATLQP